MNISKFKHYTYFKNLRYSMTYRMPFVCLNCQKSFKYEITEIEKKCSQCSQPLIMLSRKFKTPKQSDDKEWSKIKFLIEHGFRFYSYIPSKHGVHQRVKYPETMQQAYEFVEKYKNGA
jgi:DNA-directed RNA polymerase subunit RPC12/RpoP